MRQSIRNRRRVQRRILLGLTLGFCCVINAKAAEEPKHAKGADRSETAADDKIVVIYHLRYTDGMTVCQTARSIVPEASLTSDARLNAVIAVGSPDAHAHLEKFIKTETLADFDRRRVYKGPKGSLEREVVERLFRSMGIKSKRLVMEVDELNVIDILTDYIVHKLDGAVFIDYVPSSTVASILGKTGHYYKLIPAEKKPAGLGKGYFMVAVPEDVYSYQHEDYATIGIGTYLITKSGISEDTAHGIAEAIFDSVEDIEKDFSYGLGLKREDGAKNLVIPLHPGAEEYFKAVP